ncbi:MAG: hypothetical protein HQL06_04200 [Nitrospirae bacterium]|nr:hypothetical protein [Nitrospirota bacterium]
MTKDNNDKIKKIEQSLIDSFRTEQEILVSPQWHNNVMQRVKALHADKVVNNIPYSEALMWRFVTVSCCVAIISCLAALGADINPEHSLTNLLLKDPLGLITTQPFLW